MVKIKSLICADDFRTDANDSRVYKFVHTNRQI